MINMDTGPWRSFLSLLFHFVALDTIYTGVSTSANKVNASSRREHVDPPWFNTSWDAVEIVRRYGTVTLHPHSRWQSQMSLSKSVYSFQVKEDTVPGTVVGKVMGAHEDPTAITYYVREDDGENLFLLNPHSGEFLLSRSLDFETQRHYILTVVVQQGDLPVSSDRVYFNVLDVNDNPPVFRQGTYSASLLEDTHVGTCFLPLNVSDKDDGRNGALDIRVNSGDTTDVFVVNPAGILCLNTELDRERETSYNLTLTANDCAQPLSLQFTSTAYVIILINDINDNAPSFISEKSAVIFEDTTVGSVVMTVHAKDPDFGSNGEVLYYLAENSGGCFSLDNTSGQLYLREALDREQVDRLSITITAFDKGSPQRATSMNLTVHIEDVNDHDPQFPQSTYSIAVREDTPRGTSVFQAQANDLDIGANGQLRYTLSRRNPFAVDAARGLVIVMNTLDRERDSNYTLIITAVDLGIKPRSSTAVVSVTVLDVNDFTPLFSPATLMIHVMENEEDPSQLQQQILAVDDDLGTNSQLTYLIQKGNEEGLFYISPNGTFLILESMDREKISYYSLNIIAVDSGLPPLTGTLTLLVFVNDVNDNKPEFAQDVYNTIVSEDSPVGTVFAMITASDIDEGVNGEIRYLMENTDAPFSIEETSGEFFTTDVLDRETVAIFKLIVIGSDNSPTHPLSSSVLVTVIVGDVNDNWPQFLNGPYVAYVSPLMTPGSVVGSVRATDGDSEMNAELVFSLLGQNADLFFINPQSGTVFSASAFRGTEDITINVHVEDNGENPKYDITTITIRFHNASEFPEMHVDILRYVLSEDVPVGTWVAGVSAASPRTEAVFFYMASGDFDKTFHIDQSSGNVTVGNPLDYENNKDFTLLIEARDTGSPPFSSFVEIPINIIDVNDNFPHFTQSEYRCEVFENSQPMWVCDVLAIDADSGSYGSIQYSIVEGNIDRTFIIDSKNGELSTTLSLDREHISEYILTVESTDQDNPLHSDRAIVLVVVLDRNDHAPRFSQIFVSEIPEDAPIGHTVIQVISTDDDIDENAVTTYSIMNQNSVTPFSIDITNGYITVVRHLDRETQDHYVVKVNANNSAWIISTDVTIVITDANDNSPVFFHSLYTVFLPETNTQDTFVTQVLAKDRDIGQNGQIMYAIEPPNYVFWVNASSGEIYTNQPISLYNPALEIFSFTVFAFDCGSVSHYSNTTVSVQIVPYNYYPPTFLPLQPIMAIPFDFDVGKEVVQFSAFDKDLYSNSTDVEYVLNGGNASDFFRIQEDNGKILLNQSLKDHINDTFKLFVLAKDHGFPPLSAQTEISFIISEKNQYAPSFSELDYTFSVPEDLPAGSVIGKVQAEDRDYGPNGVLTYSIMPGNQYLPFSIWKDSGLLTLIGVLDFEEKVIYHLQIKAMDGGWSSKTVTVNVTVNVMDVNDNAPILSASEYIVSVPENSAVGTTVLHLNATDADSGTNTQVTYSLIAGYVDKFAIDVRNGTITTVDVFDYEREQIFDVTVKVSNQGGLYSVAHIVIEISDVNEFIPTFKFREINFSVFTNVPVGTRIGGVTAIDFDQGSEGLVFYLPFAQSKTTAFEIDEHSGEIYTTGSLRKRGNSLEILKILAKNRGVITGMDVDEALVHINIIETNNAPEFSTWLYLTNVGEDSKVGTSVITVSALDQDSILDWNHFSFNIERGNMNSSFAIHPSRGVISVNSLLDREQWPLYNLTVTATDNGSPPATGTTYVVVTIGDINDNAPRLMSTEVQVKENQPHGTIVARLNASDSDMPPNQGPFTYWFVKPRLESSFSLTPDGLLFTTRPLDREVTNLYNVLVAVRDAGITPLSSTATLHISILDENDNPPLQRNIYIEVKYYGSSFQGGMIGNVHPEDQDDSDTFNCSIRNGPLGMFTIPPGTCELWSSAFQGEATYNVTIEATDQFHFPVNNSVHVNYKGFTNASMDSCVLFYISSSSFEEFLSNKYLRFVKAFDSLFNLQASKTHVFGIKIIGTEILLLAAVKNYNGEYLNTEVASAISIGHKKLLETQSNVTISHITNDPCHTNPCENKATCNRNIHISQDVGVLESSAVIFVLPQMELFNCSCSTGFTGIWCEEDIDECEANPCENDATCVNNPGGFYCHCRSGFADPYCATDVDECLDLKCQNGGTCIFKRNGFYCHCVPGYEGELCERPIDHCKSSPCVLGNCTNSPIGFTCLCPFGVSGVHCQEHSYGFEELSFMEFPPLDSRSNLITLELATVQQTSLLLYNPGGASSQEFFTLEILNGRVQLSFDLGSGPVRLETEKQVADGHFHTITVRRIGSIASILVDNCTDIHNPGFCFTQSDSIGSERILDVGSNNFTFGGMRSIESISLHPAQIKSHNFVGCVRNINVNGVLLRHSVALATYNIRERCPRASVSPCHSTPCMNGGMCLDLWSHYVCKCKARYSGDNCATEISEDFVLRLSGNAYIEYAIQERFRRDHLLQELQDDEIKKSSAREFDVKFKTQDNGVLLFILGWKGYRMLRIKDRKLLYTASGHMAGFVVDATVADGLWHVVSLFNNGQNSVLLLDGQVVMNITNGTLDRTPVNVDKIVLGAPSSWDSMGLQPSGFSGCVEYFKVIGYTLPISGHNEMVKIWPSLNLLESSCDVPGFCVPSPCSKGDPTMMTCDHPHCENQQKCKAGTQNVSCICLHNVTNQTCDICASIENHSRCLEFQDNLPLWLIAVVLPIFIMLMIIGFFIALRHKRAKDHKNNTSPQGTEQGSDNVMFSLSDDRSLTEDASVEVCKPPDIILADKQISSVDFSSDTNPSSVMTCEPTSELEYYEIDSVFNAVHSDRASLQLTWQKNLYSPNYVKERGMGDFEIPLADPMIQDPRSQGKGNKSPLNTTTFASPYKWLSAKFDPEQSHSKESQSLQPGHFKKPKVLEPAQCLSVEEVRQLNTTLKETECSEGQSCQSEAQTSKLDVAPYSNTGSTFTCSQYDYGMLPAIPDKVMMHERTSLSACSFKQKNVLPVPHAYKHTCSSTEAYSGSMEEWGNMLSINLHFSTFADVFEDIAGLSDDITHDCDVVSDLEEIL